MAVCIYSSSVSEMNNTKNTLLELHYRVCHVVFLLLLPLWNMKEQFLLVKFTSLYGEKKEKSF